MKDTVSIKEVGPRDGLQNQPDPITTDVKVSLIRKLVASGVRYIEATAFVNPKAIPQMADADEVAKNLPVSDDVLFSALVPNIAGLERLLSHGKFREIAIFTAASETFNQKNIRASIQESFERFIPVVKKAHEHNLRVRGYVSTAFVCPYEGSIHPDQVLPVIEKLFALGCYEVSVGDTLGKATSTSVHTLFLETKDRGWNSKLAGHFHDTYGQATENVQEAWNLGIRVFDSSVGGIGGCPYAPGATGNVSTNELVRFFEGRGIATGIDAGKLDEIANFLRPFIRPLSKLDARHPT